MIDYWQRLSNRERWLLSLMSLVAILAVLYFFLLHPFYRALTEQREQFKENEPLQTYLSHALPSIKALERIDGTQKEIADSDLLATLQESLDASNLANHEKTIRQMDSNSIEIKWEAVPFDQLNDWIDNIWRTTSIQVTQLEATPTKTPGIVSAVCVLQNKKAPQNVGL